MTTLRSDAYLAAFAKTAGRRFDYAGLPILTDEEWKLVRDARLEEAVADFRRHVSVTTEVARLEWLDGSVK